MEELTSIQIGYLQLRRQDFGSAKETFENCLEESEEKALIYIGLLLAENGLSTEEQLPELSVPLSDSPLFEKALESASEDYRKTLEDYAKRQKELLDQKQEKYLVLEKGVAKDGKNLEEVDALLGLSVELKGYRAVNELEAKLTEEKRILLEEESKKRKKKKKIWIPIIAIAVLLLLVISFFFIFPKRNGIRYMLTLNGYSVFSCDEDVEIAVVEEKVFGISVTGIADKAFKDRKALKEVRLTPKVVTVGKAAFSGCKALSQITGSENVTSAGSKAFKNCKSLRLLNFASNFSFDENSTFKNCSKSLVVMAGDQKISFDPDA